MGLFTRKDSQNEPTKSLEEIQSSLNYYASYSGNGSTTEQVDRLREQLERQGYEATYVPGYNTYEITPLTYNNNCAFCSGTCTGH